MQCQIWENLVCNIGKWEQLSCIKIRVEWQSPLLLKSRRVSRILVYPKAFFFFRFTCDENLHTQFPVSSEFCMWWPFDLYQVCLVNRLYAINAYKRHYVKHHGCAWQPWALSNKLCILSVVRVGHPLVICEVSSGSPQGAERREREKPCRL